MLPLLAVIFFSSAVSAKLSGREDVVYPTLVTSRSGVKIMKFSALGQNIQLTLEPAGELISDELAVVHDGGELKYSMNAKSMKNKLYRDKEHGAALHIDEDGPLTINGIISDKLRIKPYKSKMRKDGSVPHRIVELEVEYYRIDDVVSEEIANKTSYQVRNSYAEGDCVRIDLVFLTDNTFTANFENTKKIEDYLGVMIVGMQNRIDTLNLGIKFRYKGVITYTEKTEPPYFDENSIKIKNKAYLETDKLHRSANEFYCIPEILSEDVKRLIELADIAIIVTKRRLGQIDKNGELDTSAGVAYVGGVCQPCRKFAVCRDNSDYNERVDTFVHESAHLLGSPHDGEGPNRNIPKSPGSRNCPKKDGHLMTYPQTDANKTTFSICSRKNVENLISLPGYGCIIESCDEK